MTYTIKLRRSSASDWTTVNPVLAEGEFGYELDTRNFKIGDGTTFWNDLEYVIDENDRVPSAAELEDNKILLTFGGQWIIADVPEGGGGGASASTIITEYEATEGQDDFVLPSAPTPGTVRVFRNGLKQNSDHWTLTDLTVTLSTPCVAGEDVEIEQDGPAGVITDVGPAGPEGPAGPPGPTGGIGPPGVNGVDATRGPVTINTQTGTSYTLVLADATKWIRLNNAAAITLTVPLESAVAFPIGTQIEGNQAGAGQVTIVATGGVTIHAVPGLKTESQYSVFGLLKVNNDEWLAYGRLSA